MQISRIAIGVHFKGYPHTLVWHVSYNERAPYPMISGLFTLDKSYEYKRIRKY